jgi:hypothetical protein
MADFVLNRWDLEILLYYHSAHTAVRPLSYAESSIGSIRRECVSPVFYSIGPDWFEHGFVDEEFIICREFGFATE